MVSVFNLYGKIIATSQSAPVDERRNTLKIPFIKMKGERDYGSQTLPFLFWAWDTL
jgi:hypothetical protein